MKIIAVFLLLLLSNFAVQAQEKHLNKKKVSSVIITYIKSQYLSASNIRFYQEKVNDSLFVESTFKFQEDRYSLKFYRDSLIEVEVLVRFKELPEVIQRSIIQYLDEHYKKYKVLECLEINPKKNPLYEINIKGKGEKSEGDFELLFDKQGHFIRNAEIISQPIPSLF